MFDELLINILLILMVGAGFVTLGFGLWVAYKYVIDDTEVKGMKVKLLLERTSEKTLEKRRRIVTVVIPHIDNTEREEKGVWVIRGYYEENNNFIKDFS